MDTRRNRVIEELKTGGTAGFQLLPDYKPSPGSLTRRLCQPGIRDCQKRAQNGRVSRVYVCHLDRSRRKNLVSSRNLWRGGGHGMDTSSLVPPARIVTGAS